MSDSEKKLIQTYAAKTIQSQVNYLENQMAGIQQPEGIEYLHHTRVMSRRIRNTIEVFAPYFGKKTARKWLKSFSALTKNLTNIRDLDVQIAFLQNELAQLENPKFVQGINRILLRKTQKRNKGTDIIERAIGKFEESNVLKEVKDFIANHSFDELVFSATATLSELAEQHVEENIRQCFLYVPFITSPTNFKELHRLRITIKNLRYIVELFLYLYPSLNESLDILKSFQDDLGKIHDCDVWIDELDKFENKEKEKIYKFYGQNGAFNFITPGLDYLRVQISETRSQTYDQFLYRWNLNFQDQFWTRLRAQITNFPVYEKKPAQETKDSDVSEEPST